MNESQQIENYIDKLGLAGFLEVIAEIASEKAQHISENWQDEGLAVSWQLASDAIMKCAQRVHNEAL